MIERGEARVDIVDALRVLADGLPSKACGDAADTITTLRAQLAEVTEARDYYAGLYADRVGQLNLAHSQLAEARDAFRKYGRHGPFCNDFGPTPMCCSCGFSAALAKMDTPEPMPDGEH